MSAAVPAEIRFHRLAAEEYREARRWYEARRAGLGARFLAEVDRAAERIAADPDRWPTFRHRFRRVRLRRFPYSLFYHQVDAEHILVVAVAHIRRRPGDWIRRVPR